MTLLSFVSLNHKHKAFTVIELLTVIIIIGVLSGMVMVTSTSITENATAIRLIAGMRNMKAAACVYNAEKKTWPVWLYFNGNYVNRDLGNEAILPNLYLDRIPVEDSYWIGVMKHPTSVSAAFVVADVSRMGNRTKEAIAEKASGIVLYGSDTIGSQAPDLSSLTEFKASDKGIIWVINK